MISIEYDGEYGFTIFNNRKFVKTVYKHDAVHGDVLEKLKRFAFSEATHDFKTDVDIALSIISMSYLCTRYRGLLTQKCEEYLRNIDYAIPENYTDLFDDVFSELTQQQQAAFWMKIPLINQ